MPAFSNVLWSSNLRTVLSSIRVGLPNAHEWLLGTSIVRTI